MVSIILFKFWAPTDQSIRWTDWSIGGSSEDIVSTLTPVIILCDVCTTDLLVTNELINQLLVGANLQVLFHRAYWFLAPDIGIINQYYEAVTNEDPIAIRNHFPDIPVSKSSTGLLT